jgi:hypothetical protein
VELWNIAECIFEVVRALLKNCFTKIISLFLIKYALDIVVKSGFSASNVAVMGVKMMRINQPRWVSSVLAFLALCKVGFVFGFCVPCSVL